MAIREERASIEHGVALKQSQQSPIARQLDTSPGHVLEHSAAAGGTEGSIAGAAETRRPVAVSPLVGADDRTNLDAEVVGAEVRCCHTAKVGTH